MVSNLNKDLARSLGVGSIRIVEVIEGRETIGVEIPNADRESVMLGEVIASKEFEDAKSPLTLAYGKDIEGKPKKEPYYKLDASNTIVQGVHKTTTSKQKKRIVLTDLGETVLAYLIQHFYNMICIEFTAQVETDLDRISEGNTEFHTIIKKVYDSFYPMLSNILHE